MKVMIFLPHLISEPEGDGDYRLVDKECLIPAADFDALGKILPYDIHIKNIPDYEVNDGTRVQACRLAKPVEIAKLKCIK